RGSIALDGRFSCPLMGTPASCQNTLSSPRSCPRAASNLSARARTIQEAEQLTSPSPDRDRPHLQEGAPPEDPHPLYRCLSSPIQDKPGRPPGKKPLRSYRVRGLDRLKKQR